MFVAEEYSGNGALSLSTYVAFILSITPPLPPSPSSSPSLPLVSLLLLPVVHRFLLSLVATGPHIHVHAHTPIFPALTLAFIIALPGGRLERCSG
jgi:hypothetical protein